MSEHTPEAWQRTLDRVKNLSAAPAVLAALMQTLSDPRSSAGDVAEIVAADPALTGKLLRVANSAYYGAKGEVATPSRAVALIGYSEVRAVCCVIAAAAMLPMGRPLRHFDRADFWKHSLATGTAAKMLAARAKAVDPELAFVSGLLHDMGKLVFQQYANQQFAEALDQAQDTETPLRQTERTFLGLDHARLGRWVAQHWQLPDSIVAAVGRHHDPMPAAKHFGMIAAAHAGNVVAHLGAHGASGEARPQEMEDCVRDALHLSSQDLGPLGQELTAEMDRSAEIIGALVGPENEEGTQPVAAA